MPVETATYINQLNPAYPQAGDQRSEGDDHVRLIKQALKTTLPNLEAPMVRTAPQLNAAPYNKATLDALTQGKVVVATGGWGNTVSGPPSEIELGFVAATKRLRARVGGTYISNQLLTVEEFLGGNQDKTTTLGFQRQPGDFAVLWGQVSLDTTTSGGGFRRHTISFPKDFIGIPVIAEIRNPRFGETAPAVFARFSNGMTVDIAATQSGGVRTFVWYAFGYLAPVVL